MIVCRPTLEKMQVIFRDTRRQQSHKLLEYFLAKKDHRVHWVEAIMIFAEWQKKRDDINKLKRIFSQRLCRIGTEFRKRQLEPIKFRRLSGGYWELMPEFHSNIAESQKLVKKIQGDLGKAKSESVKINLEKAVEIYDRNLDAAKLVLALKDKIGFDNRVLDKARNNVLMQKTVLEEQIIPTLKFYVQHRQEINWKEMERIEFSQVQILLDEVVYDHRELTECLKGTPEFHDEEYDEIKRLIKEARYDELQKKKAIVELVNKTVNFMMKRQKDKSYGMVWQWFKSYDVTVIRQFAEASLVRAIDENRENVNFLIAWRTGILMNYLFKITKVQIRNTLYQEVLQLPSKAIKDRKKAIQWIELIIEEHNGIMPPREKLRILLCEKTGRPLEYSDYLLFLYDKGMEEHLDEKTALDKSGLWRESPQEKAHRERMMENSDEDELLD